MKAQEIAEKLPGDHNLYFKSLLFADYASALLGVISIIKGNLSEGIKMVEETKQNIIESGRKGWIAFWENLLGSVYLQMAIGGEKSNLSFLFKNILFLMKNAPHAARKAETHFNNAIEHAKVVGAKGTLGQAYLNLGLLHQARKRVGKAKECLSEAVLIFEETEAQVYLKQVKETMESLIISKVQ